SRNCSLVCMMCGWGLRRRMFSFFQAEGGIRDGHVTGVQTCALPIFGAASPALPRDPQVEELGGQAIPALDHHDVRGLEVAVDDRSEERRVGKECRSRGSADQ